MRNSDNAIRYIVQLKDDFYMPKTTIKRTFCGSIENINTESIYFKLNGCNALIIIPHEAIKWMAPSKILFKQGYNVEKIFSYRYYKKEK